VYKKSLGMRHFRFSVPGRGRAGPLPRLPESLGMEGTRQKAPKEAVGCTIDASQEAKREILVEREQYGRLRFPEKEEICVWRAKLAGGGRSGRC